MTIRNDSQPHENALFTYVGAFVAELPRVGVRHAVVCPGSRSTPLAMAFAAQPDIRVWMQIDERSAAFFALGLAKQTQAPVALLCTSGTAAANFFPAIVEANLSHVPLIVMTADRPPELRDNGAPQTIDQIHLYGSHVKWFSEVALPDATPAAMRYIRTLASRAAATARALPIGPVHLNFPLREPLVPDHAPAQSEHPAPAATMTPAAIAAPDLSVTTTPLGALSATTRVDIAGRFARTTRGVIIVGPNDHTDLAAPVIALAHTLQYPILADPLSGLRGLAVDDPLVCASYDAFLRDPAFVASHAPQIIVRFGAMPVAKPVLQYIQHYADCPLYVIDGSGGWNEPTQLATAMIQTDPARFCVDLLATLATTDELGHSTWCDSWSTVEQTTRTTLSRGIAAFTEPFEGRVFTELATLLPPGSTLFVGNSMPVRDLDTFFWHAPGVHIFANRGANGIDGVTSTALGVSAAHHQSRTVLVIGDLSFYHDLNGLLAAKLYDLDLTIVLIDNDGGGIFSFLPQADFPQYFEQLFGTPTGLDFAPVVGMYGGTFTHAANWEQFRDAVTQGMDAGGLHVVQVTTERTSNVALHRQLWRDLTTALSAQISVAHDEQVPT